MSQLPPSVHVRAVTALVGICRPDERVVVTEHPEPGEPAAMIVCPVARLDASGSMLAPGEVLIFRRRGPHLIARVTPEGLICG
jgi:hypothetical protein